MVGIVVVSHSRRLADAAVELALEMVTGEKPPIAIAAGTADGSTGTDATKVADAIAEVSTGAGCSSSWISAPPYSAPDWRWSFSPIPRSMCG